MRILGIDPGLAATGWGLIDYPDTRVENLRWGVVRTPAGHDDARRLLCIHDALRALIEEHRPEAVAIEKIFFSRNVKTAVVVAQARGAALLATAHAGLPVGEYTPNEIKKAVSGRGGAGKAQVQQMVARLLGLREAPRPDHAADALAAALCHGHSLKTQRLTGLSRSQT